MKAPSPQVLLIQIRDAHDPGIEHERACVAHRLANHPVELATVNGLSGQVELAQLDSVELLIIGGAGDYSVHDPRSSDCVAGLRRLLDYVLQRQLPTFGICFGHQLLGYHLGAAVRTDEAHAEIGTVALDLTAAGRHDPVFGELPDQFGAHTGHSDHVTTVPPGVDLLVTGHSLEAQAFKVRGAPLYTTQFHPDMTGAEAITRYLTYQESFAATLPDQVSGAVNRFRPGEDAATLLLARFLECVTQGDT